MTVAFLFPGQGTDIADATDAWRRQSPHVERLLERAAAALAISADRLVQPTMLTRTAVLQPVLTALTLGIHHFLRDHGVDPAIVAGHSVGELAACAAAGAIADEDAVSVAATRGDLMEREASRHGGRMIAVRGSADEVQTAIARASAHGRVTLAAHNTDDEWVLSGDVVALRAVEAVLPATPLDTSGPWHSAAMAGAVDSYRDALRAAVTGPLSVPVVCNRTGDLVPDAEALPDLLASQLTRPVQWVRTMETLRMRGVTSLVVCGPGKSLRRFAQACIRDAEVSIVAHPDNLPRDLAATMAR